jgi:Flp pilus assembly pilin Flp
MFVEKAKKFIKEEDGMGTVEIVIIIGVLIAIALIFSKQIKNLVGNMTSTMDRAGDNAASEAIDPDA